MVPRACQLQEAVLHQVGGIYTNIIHHIDVLDGLILSLDEGGTTGTCLNGTLFRSLRADGIEKQRLRSWTDLTTEAALPKGSCLKQRDSLHKVLSC